MINPAWFTPAGGILGGGAAVAGYYYTHRKDREAKRWTDALIRDEILGHKNVEGIPDKKSISERMGLMEISTGQMAKELHPNGGTSMLDTVNSTHALAQQAAVNAAAVADTMEKRERMRLAGEALIANRIRAHPEMKELNDLLNLLPPPEEQIP